MSNIFFDIVIIGATREGRSISKLLDAASTGKSIALVSNRFPIEDQAFKKSSVKNITKTVTYLSYNRGLIGLTCNSDSQPSIFCTQLVIATGTKSLVLACPGSEQIPVYYHIADIPKSQAKETCVVFGSTKKAIRLALLASNLYKQVYYCPQCFEFPAEVQVRLNTLKKHSNVQILNGSLPTNVLQKDTKINVSLDTGAEIICDAVLAALDEFPDTAWIPDILCPKDTSGKLIVNEEHQSVRVPTIYACGDIVTDYKSTINREIVDSICKQKIGGR